MIFLLTYYDPTVQPVYACSFHNLFFFFNDTATTEIYTLSLPDALPIYELAAGGLTIEPFLLVLSCSSSGAWRLRIALGEQLVQGIPPPLLGLHDETSALNRDADLGARLQVQDIEQRGRDGQHDRAADLAQIGSVHAFFL